MQHYHVLLANGDPDEDTPEGQKVADLHFSAGKVGGSWGKVIARIEVRFIGPGLR